MEDNLRPLYFGTNPYRLFGVYHAPRGAKPNAPCILLCAPLGHEYMRSYYILRQLAEQLSDVGNHVFRFDWFGYGDSAGENGEGNISTWTNNILDAADELKCMSGSNELSLIGFRMGAAFAWESLKSLQNVKNLVLWEPVCGANWILEIQKMHKDFLSDMIKTRNSSLRNDEYLGFIFPTSVQYEISLLQYKKNEVPAGCRVHLFMPENMNCSSTIQLNDILSHDDYYYVNYNEGMEIWNNVRFADRVIMSNQALPKLVNLFSETTL